VVRVIFCAHWAVYVQFLQLLNNNGQSNTEEKHLDSDFRRNDLKMLCIVNKLLPGVIEQLPISL